MSYCIEQIYTKYGNKWFFVLQRRAGEGMARLLISYGIEWAIHRLPWHLSIVIMLHRKKVFISFGKRYQPTSGIAG